MLCDDQEGWDEGRGRESPEGREYVYIHRITLLYQHCKAIILQEKRMVFPADSDSKISACHAGDRGFDP